MTVSAVLAFLSLLGFAAIWGQALWKTRIMQKDSWGLYKHGFDKMPDVIEYALRYCLNRGFMVIEDRNSDHFIQFRKYILRNRDHGLELGFPEAGWSKAYFAKLRDALTADGIPFRETRESGGDVTAFIHVDCGRDVDKCVGLARLCFFDIFGLAPDTTFASKPEHYSSIGDQVDDLDYVNPSSCREWWSRFRAHWREEGPMDPALAFIAAGYTVGFTLCHPALWLSWFQADGAAPGWRLSLWSIQLAGDHGTWVLLLLFCVMVGGMSRTRQELARDIKPRPRTLIDRIGAPLAVFGLPAAVTVSWLGL